MLVTIFFALYGFGAVFVICELIQQIIDQYDELNDIFVQLKWYFYSTKIKRLLPIIIMSVQAPVSVESFGSIGCDRESFKKVNLSNWSIRGLFISLIKLYRFLFVRSSMVDFHGSQYFVKLISETILYTFEIVSLKIIHGICSKVRIYSIKINKA